MSKAVITEALLTDIADAIRSKTGGANSMTPADMATAIATDIDKLPAYILDSLDPIVYDGRTLGEWAFAGRSGGSSSGVEIQIPNVVTLAARAFFGAKLKALSAPGITNMQSNALYGLDFPAAGSTITFPALVQVSNRGAFAGIDILGNSHGPALVRFPAFQHYASTAAGYLFRENLSLSIAADVDNGITEITQIDDSLPAQGTRVYMPLLDALTGSDCAKLLSLTTVNLPYIASVGNDTFNGCSGLTSVIISNATSIGNYSFLGCSALASIDASQVATIGSGAFRNCAALTAIRLPKITAIGTSAFNGCSSLAGLILPIDAGATLPTLAATNAIANTPIASGTGYIYITDSRVNELKAATNWSTYAAQIRPLSEYTGE